MRLIRSLGFKVSPALDNTQSNMDELVRLGINTFCFLNVMLVAVPEYVDANLRMDYEFWQLFRWLSLGFASVVMTYGAWPHYRAAWGALRQRRLHIDQSIALALLATFAYSLTNVVFGGGEVYFDSVCAIVALLGWGRYLQKRVMQSAEQSIRGGGDYAMQFVRAPSGDQVVPLSEVAEGDSFLVLPGPRLSAKGSAFTLLGGNFIWERLIFAASLRRKGQQRKFV